MTIVAATLTAMSAAEALESEMSSLETISPPLAVFLDDLTRLLPESRMPDWELLAGKIPHLVLLFDSPDADPEVLRDGVQTVEDHARNHRLFVERQFGIEGSGRASVIVSLPFPTVRLCWDGHPYEDVPVEDGVWQASFADLSDVEEIRNTEAGQTTLFLYEDAVKRIDEAAIQSGHRRFHLRVGPRGQESLIGPYVWMPGLGCIRGLPAASETHVTTTYSEMQSLFLTRKVARDRVAAWLLLENKDWWVAPSVRAYYSAPLVLWGMDSSDALPFYAPWYRGEDVAPTWMPLRAGNLNLAAVALPGSWVLRAIDVGANHATVPVLSSDPEAPEVGEFQAFLRQYQGADVAVLIHGDVIGTVTVPTSRPTSMQVNTGTGLSAEALVARARVVGGEVGAASIDVAARMEETEAAISKLDFFQVRIMAEPQDRKLVSVTHFAAPGSAAGVVVSVLNDVILDSRAITDARIEERADRIYLHLSLTPEGKESLSNACFTYLGKQLAIVYEDRLLCAPTIVDWEPEELTFKGMNEDWPEVAAAMVARLGKG